MTQTRWMARQGDVLVMAVDAIPAEAMAHVRPVDGGRVVLAYGEVTGHAHAILPGRVSASLLDAHGRPMRTDEHLGLPVTAYGPSDDAFWLEVTQPGAAIVHEEHAPIVIPAGVTRLAVIRQREYSGAGERRVAD